MVTQATATKVDAEADQLTLLCKWWFEECHANLSLRARKLLALFGAVGGCSPDQTANDLGNAVYGVALKLVYNHMPQHHMCHDINGYNSMGNVVEGILGLMWAKSYLTSSHDFERYQVPCYQDKYNEVYEFVQRTDAAIVQWRPLLEAYLLDVNSMLHSSLFGPYLSARSFAPDVVLAHIEAIRLGWSDAFECNAVVNGIVIHPVFPNPAMAFDEDSYDEGSWSSDSDSRSYSEYSTHASTGSSTHRSYDNYSGYAYGVSDRDLYRRIALLQVHSTRGIPVTRLPMLL